ncbi:hypothetical protein J6590_009291 [Homalodisca vitripennis]|nr:hypothetical protein J6590_009291 [Homalodisca vitripennis]
MYIKIKRVRKTYKRGLLAVDVPNNPNGDDNLEMKPLNNSEFRKIETLPKGQNREEVSKDCNSDDVEMKPRTTTFTEIEIQPKGQNLMKKSKDYSVDKEEMKPFISKTKVIQIQAKVQESKEKFANFKIDGLEMKPHGSQAIAVNLKIKRNKKVSFSTT